MGKIFFVTGECGSGKSHFLDSLLRECSHRNLKPDGLLSPKTCSPQGDINYYLFFPRTGRKIYFSGHQKKPGTTSLGPFWFDRKAITAGKEYLRSLNPDPDFLILDEIGPLELNGHLWAEEFELLLHSCPVPMVVSIRPAILERAVRHWQIKSYTVWPVGSVTASQALDLILDEINAILRRQHR